MTAAFPTLRPQSRRRSRTTDSPPIKGGEIPSITYITLLFDAFAVGSGCAQGHFMRYPCVILGYHSKIGHYGTLVTAHTLLNPAKRLK